MLSGRIYVIFDVKSYYSIYSHYFLQLNCDFDEIIHVLVNWCQDLICLAANQFSHLRLIVCNLHSITAYFYQCQI